MKIGTIAVLFEKHNPHQPSKFFEDWNKELFGNQKAGISKYDYVPCHTIIGVWKKLKQKMDERHIKRCPNIGHEKSKH
jgi:hypothetical protein